MRPTDEPNQMIDRSFLVAKGPVILPSRVRPIDSRYAVSGDQFWRRPLLIVVLRQYTSIAALTLNRDGERSMPRWHLLVVGLT
jgi:hypothetical protein